MKMSEIVKKRLCFICGEKYKINRGLSNYIGSELNTCDTCGSNYNDLNDIAKFYYINSSDRITISFDKKANTVVEAKIVVNRNSFEIKRLDIDYDNYELIDNLIKKYDYERLL